MYSNPVGLGADLADKRFKNELATPNVDDEDAALFAKIGKIAGDKPKGWNALLSGLATGAEYGSRTKSTAKKQEALSKYDKVMEYFQEVNHAASERNKWYETREIAQQKYLPQVMSYAENITKLDPQSQRLMAQNILDGWNRTTGDDYQLSSIDGTDPFVMTISSKQGTKIIDIRDMFSGNEALQNRLAMKTPEYQMQLQEKRKQQEFENKIAQGNLDIKEGYLKVEKENAPIKYSIQNRRIAATEDRNDMMENKTDIKLDETLGKKIDAADEFLRIAPKMEEIVKKHPDIFQSAMDALWRDNNAEPGFLSNMLKDVQKKWNPEKANALTGLIKYINKMTLDVTNGFSRPNMFIEKIGSKAVPNLDMTPDEFLKVLSGMKEENKRTILKSKERAKIFSKNKELNQFYDDTTSEVMGSPQNDLSDLGSLIQ